MRTGWILSASLTLSLAASLAGTASADDCKLERAASLQVHLGTDGRLLADGKINGHEAAFAVAPDLGYSAVTAAAARQFGLALDNQKHQSLFFDGTKLDTIAVVPTLDVGGLSYRDISLPVLPGAETPGEPAGVAGGDLLEHYDIELDLADGTLNLFKPPSCKVSPVYWAKEWFEQPFTAGDNRRIETTVTVGGKPLQTVIDLGAAHSVLSRDAARSLFAIAPDEMQHRFDGLVLGGITFHNVELQIGATQAADARPGAAETTQLRLGVHELKRLRVYLDYAAGKMEFTVAAATPTQ